MKKYMKSLLVVVMIISLINFIFDIYLFKSSYNTKSNYEMLLNEYVAEEENMYHLAEMIYEIQALSLTQIVTTDEELSETCTTKINDLHKEIEQILVQHKNHISSQKENVLFHQVYSSYVSYKSQQLLVADLHSQNADETAHYYVNSLMTSQLSDLNYNLDQLNAYTENQIKKVRSSLDQNNHITNILSITFAVLSLLTIIGMLFLFRKFSGRIVDRFNSEQQQHREQLIQMQSKTIEGMADLVESRDGETGQHIKNTAFYVELLARKLSETPHYKEILTNDYIALLKQFAPLHDVGKIVISDAILLKPAKLTESEFDIMKMHTVEGGRIIRRILSDIETEEHVTIACDIATYHHEKWNGTGYPCQLSGTDIPLCARIMSVADVFDALISKRCYKKAFPIEEAYRIIEESSGSQFDPEIVEAFMELKPDIDLYLSVQNSA